MGDLFDSRLEAAISLAILTACVVLLAWMEVPALAIAGFVASLLALGLAGLLLAGRRARLERDREAKERDEFRTLIRTVEQSIDRGRDPH